MAQYNIKDETLRKAAEEGMDAFMEAVAQAIKDGVGGELSAETMPKLTADQITLLGYLSLREEVMDGGFIQLIHNGWGGFFFDNPFDFAIKQWGLADLCSLMRRVKRKYRVYQEEIEADMTDEEFMALYEEFSVFDDFDDEFVSNEEQWTNMVACYLDDHLDAFVKVTEG